VRQKETAAHHANTVVQNQRDASVTANRRRNVVVVQGQTGRRQTRSGRRGSDRADNVRSGHPVRRAAAATTTRRTRRSKTTTRRGIRAATEAVPEIAAGPGRVAMAAHFGLGSSQVRVAARHRRKYRRRQQQRQRQQTASTVGNGDNVPGRAAEHARTDGVRRLRVPEQRRRFAGAVAARRADGRRAVRTGPVAVFSGVLRRRPVKELGIRPDVLLQHRAAPVERLGLIVLLSIHCPKNGKQNTVVHTVHNHYSSTCILFIEKRNIKLQSFVGNACGR